MLLSAVGFGFQVSFVHIECDTIGNEFFPSVMSLLRVSGDAVVIFRFVI